MSMIELVMYLTLRFKRLLERKKKNEKKNDEAESAYSELMSFEYPYLAFPNREFLI